MTERVHIALKGPEMTGDPPESTARTASLTATEAHSKGWRQLTVFLAEVDHLAPRGLNLQRTFNLWRHGRVVPSRSIREPIRGWLGGTRVVLWPPETRTFMEDALRLRPYASLKGGSRPRVPDAAAHAALRLGLWAWGWDYDDETVRQSLLGSISRLPLNTDEGKNNFVRAIANLMPEQAEREFSSDQSYAEALRQIDATEQRLARLSRISFKGIRRAIQTARHSDLQSVRDDAGRLLRLSLSLLTGSKDPLKNASTASESPFTSLFASLALPFLIGTLYMALRPLTLEDVPKALSLFIGVRLAEKRVMTTRP